MAAFLRQGARRIVGSVLQRTQAAVTSPAFVEEGRRLATRRMTTIEHPPHARPAAAEIQHMKEKLYDVLSKATTLRDGALLQDLVAGHIKPRPHMKQWRQLRIGRKISNFVEITGTTVFVSLAYGFYSMPDIYERVAERVAMMEREDQVRKRAVMERESQVEKA